jgi:hypothetical protein
MLEQTCEESSQNSSTDTSIISYNDCRLNKLQSEIDQITSEITPYLLVKLVAAF